MVIGIPGIRIIELTRRRQRMLVRKLFLIYLPLGLAIVCAFTLYLFFTAPEIVTEYKYVCEDGQITNSEELCDTGVVCPDGSVISNNNWNLTFSKEDKLIYLRTKPGSKPRCILNVDNEVTAEKNMEIDVLDDGNIEAKYDSAILVEDFEEESQWTNLDDAYKLRYETSRSLSGRSARLTQNTSESDNNYGRWILSFDAQTNKKISDSNLNEMKLSFWILAEDAAAVRVWLEDTSGSRIVTSVSISGKEWQSIEIPVIKFQLTNQDFDYENLKALHLDIYNNDKNNTKGVIVNAYIDNIYFTEANGSKHVLDVTQIVNNYLQEYMNCSNIDGCAAHPESADIDIPVRLSGTVEGRSTVQFLCE
ncbi:MAG: hypothetical protein ABH879_08810 [archaeon]